MNRELATRAREDRYIKENDRGIVYVDDEDLTEEDNWYQYEALQHQADEWLYDEVKQIKKRRAEYDRQLEREGEVMALCKKFIQDVTRVLYGV
jgi:hypothetical protein